MPEPPDDQAQIRGMLEALAREQQHIRDQLARILRQLGPAHRRAIESRRLAQAAARTSRDPRGRFVKRK